MIVNDITFIDTPKGMLDTVVFCRASTKSIHFNANYDKDMFCDEDLMGNPYDYEHYLETNMGQIISHETIHLAILEKVGLKASHQFDFVELKYNVSEYNFISTRERAKRNG